MLESPRPERLVFLATSLCLIWTAVARAQSIDTLDLLSVGRDARWKVANRTTSFADVKGKRALRVSEAPGMGLVWLEGLDFGNGTIDVDVLGRSAPVQGSFVGVAFHVLDARTHEAVYFRPFNFRAKDPTAHGHAVQYVSHPQWPWDRLRSERPGVFEHAVTPEVDGDEWFHARIVIARPNVRVYVNDASTPTLVVDELGDRTHGFVGLWVGEGSGGYFANLRVHRAP
jgi:hypothetical protein